MDKVINKNINNIMRDIIAIRHKSPRRELELCQKLYDLATKIEDDFAKAFAYLYMSDAYLSFGKISEALKYGNKGIELQLANKYDDLLMTQYNILGLVYNCSGDERSAVESYFKGIHIAQIKRNHIMIGTMQANLAMIYIRMGAIDNAYTAFLESYKTVEMATENKENVLYTEEMHYQSLAWVHYEKKEYELALEYIKKSKKGDFNVELRINNLLVEAKIYSDTNRNSSALSRIEQIIKMLDEIEDILTVFFTKKDIFVLLLKMNKLIDAKKILTQLEEVTRNINMPAKWTEYYQCVVEYSKAVEDKEMLLEAYKEFYQWDKVRNKILIEARYARVKDRVALQKILSKNEKMQEKEKELKYKAEYDQLTQTANRHLLDKYSKKMITNAKKRRISFAVVILDIDYFKQYNDRYGHLEGDNCLICVADSIKECADEDVFICRYGGDEFIVVFEGKSNKEIEHIITNIQIKLFMKNIINEESLVSKNVTLSIGIANSIPGEADNIERYIDVADSALYAAKRKGRNMYCFSKDMMQEGI